MAPKTLRYYIAGGKQVQRDVGLAALEAGSFLNIEATTHSVRITKEDDNYCADCMKGNCNNKCKMKKPISAVEWVETHLRQFHA